MLLPIIGRTLKILAWLALLLLLMLIYLLHSDAGLMLVIDQVKQSLPGKLTISKVSGKLASTIHLHGLTYSDPQTNLHIDDLTLKWRLPDLLLHHITIKEISAKSLTVQVTNTSTTPVSIQIPQLPYSITLQKIKLSKIAITAANYPTVNLSTINGNGQINFLPQLHWQADLNVATENDSTPQQKNYPNHFSFQLHSSGEQQKQQQIITHTVLNNISGTLNKQSLHGFANIDSFNDQITAGNAELFAGNAHLKIQANYFGQWRGQWQANVPNFGLLLPNSSGMLQSSGSFNGPTNALNLQASLQAKNLSFSNYKIGQWQSDSKIIPGGSDSYLKISASNLLLAGRPLESIHLLTRGTLQQQQTTIQLQNNQQKTLFSASGTITATLNPNHFFTAQMQMHFANNEILTGNLTLPKYRGNGLPQATQPLQGNLQVSLRHLELLTLLFPPLRNPTGDLQGKVQISGTLGAPHYAGTVALNNAKSEIPTLNITLEKMNLLAHLFDDGRLDFNANANSGGGTLSLHGNGSLEHNIITADLSLNGQNFLTVNNEIATIYTSPHLTINTHGKDIRISGEIVLPQAKVHPGKSTDSFEQTEDVVIVNDRAPVTSQPLPMNVSSDIKLILGDKVFLDYVGIAAQLAGQITINQRPDSPATANGILHAVNGQYTAYGQQLTLTRGRLVFTGGPVTDPGLDVQASKTINTVAQPRDFNLLNPSTFAAAGSLFSSQTTKLLLGVSVQHTLQKPQISFFSQPSGLSQADILSYLLVGKPVNDINSADRQTLINAVSVLNIGDVGGINSATNQIKNKLGLSDLDIESESDIGAGATLVENTSLVLGKYLTPRLYVNYSIGLLQRINTFHARYSLNKNWVIQGETNAYGNGADLFFSIEQ